ncbi:hypothetical protein Ocin01_08300, partial [Orchesella cincta]
VVETVFEHLKFADLKRARLVCHVWYRNATKLLPKKSRSLLFGDGKKQFETFLKLAQSSFFPLPHRKITLQSSILSLNRSQSLETFFTTCNSFLHSLYLTYQDESHLITGSQHHPNHNNLTTDYDNYLFPTLTELPNLKHFHYEEIPSGDYYPLGKNRNCLKGHVLFDKLLRASRNLERLDLILQDTDIYKTEQHFLSLVNCSKTFGTLRFLRTLMLKLPLQDYHFELLERAGLLNVVNIQLRFQNEQCSATSPLKFLGNYAGSLRTLSTNIWMRGFSDRKIASEEDLIFPCLPKLENLEISQWRSFIGSGLPFHFSYKSSFPHLTRLTLQSHSWERCWDAFFPQKEVCHTLQELKLPKLLENQKNIIPKIAKTFPELKKLDVTVIPSSVDVLSDIFCYLWRLEELSVNFLHGRNNTGGEGNVGRTSMCIDWVMTGIPEAICRKIYSEDQIPDVKVDLLETGYSLASLKYLKTLHLKNLSSVNYGIPQFTDITGYLAMLKLKRLRTLYIWRSQMSDECISALDKNYKLFLHPNF